MPTTITLGRYFEDWQRNHVQTDASLAEYLGVTVARLPSLAAEPVKPGGDTAESDAGSARPMPPPPLPEQLEPIADRHGVNSQRLRNVIYGRY
jgi:hypothetical protein